MPGTFVLDHAKNGKYKFNLRASNHQVVLTSEIYESKVAAEKGIESVRKNAIDDVRFTRKKAKDGHTYFVLTSLNGETVGKSEMYSRPSSMEKGILSVRTNAPKAKLVDMTR